MNWAGALTKAVRPARSKSMSSVVRVRQSSIPAPCSGIYFEPASWGWPQSTPHTLTRNAWDHQCAPTHRGGNCAPVIVLISGSAWRIIFPLAIGWSVVIDSCPMKYRCVASTPEGLVQQVAVSYLRHGYWWYTTGRIPGSKNPDDIDRKLVAKYGIDISERQRARRKSRGLANMQYIRYQNWFLLLCTEGHHPFRTQENIRDCRRNPIRFEGYSISYRRAGFTPPGSGPHKWHACVRIEPETYSELKAYFLQRACHRKTESLTEDFQRIPFARYAPIRRQLLNIHRNVNNARLRMGYTAVPVSCLNLRRKIAQPFSEPGLAIAEVA